MPVEGRKPTLTILVGMPGSGKSEYVLQETCLNANLVAVIPGEIRSRPELRSLRGWDLANAACSIALKEIGQQLVQGRDVVFSATNTGLRSRGDAIAVGRQYAGRVVCVWLRVPVEKCVERYLDSFRGGSPQTRESLLRLAANLEKNPPTETEGFDEVTILTHELAHG